MVHLLLMTWHGNPLPPAAISRFGLASTRLHQASDLLNIFTGMHLWLCAACVAIAVAARRLGSEIKSNGSPHTQGLEGSVVDGEYGRYQLVKELGAGAYGTVYRAKEQNGRQVVAKVIDIRTEEPKFSFLTERRVWKHMQRCQGYPHPNVIQYFEALQLPNNRGVVIMELADGGSLSETLYNKVSAESTLGGTRTAFGDALLTDEALAKKLFGQLAAGAEWLGKCGVVHKDLKPDNVMLTKPFLEGGIIKIIDFGLAMLTSDQRAGPVANMYYNLYPNADPRSNKKGARTFDDFALGLMLAEIGTGVPPYFNPDFDYYSKKQGNLQNEKGIFYILQPKRVCEKGDVGIKDPKTDLAYGKVSIKTAVKEVVGRSLYYLQNGHHFIYTSAMDQGIGNVQLLKKSWLYNSQSAMSLLYSLMVGRQEDRIEPSTLMSTEWLSDVESPAPSSPIPEMPQEMETFAPPSPAISEDVHFSPPEPPLEEDLPQEEEEEEEVEKEEAPKLNMCRNPYKERGPASLCKVRHSSHGDCYVDVSCSGAPSKVVKLEQGWGAGTVPNCRNCRLS